MSTNAPVNLAHNIPTGEDELWLKLYTDIGGSADFWPVTIKAFYVYGLLESILRSAEFLLQSLSGQVTPSQPGRFLSAFGIQAAAVELLGKCLLGIDNTRSSTKSLLVGFRWLFRILESAPVGIGKFQAKH